MRRECQERFPCHRRWRTCRNACRDRYLAVSFKSRWRGKRSRHSRRMRNPQFHVSGKKSIAEKNAQTRHNPVLYLREKKWKWHFNHFGGPGNRPTLSSLYHRRPYSARLFATPGMDCYARSRASIVWHEPSTRLQCQSQFLDALSQDRCLFMNVHVYISRC